MNEKGQTLIVVMMVMIIALATGLVVSERIISGQRRTTTLDSSSRALFVAEALVERILNYPPSTLDTYITNNSCGSNCALTIVGDDNITADAVATLAFSGNSTDTFDIDVNKDETYEINLIGYSGSAAIELCWDDATTGDNPSVYVTYIHGSASPYTMNKYAYNSASTLYSSNGFTSSAPADGYSNCFTITAKTGPQFIRVRPAYNDLALHVVPKNGATLPSQGYVITSTGSVNEIKKTIQVIKTKPFLPSEFDFAIFSTGADNPLQN